MKTMETTKIVVVIGASRGIGLGFAQHYLKKGYQVVATCRDYARSEGLKVLKEQYEQTLTVYDGIENTDIDCITRFASLIPRLDLLILNAGLNNHRLKSVG